MAAVEWSCLLSAMEPEKGAVDMRQGWLRGSATNNG